jgi:hypothetical protein
VFVAHTGADLRCLRGELTRLSDSGGSLGVSDLPVLPIIDTSTPPRLVTFPGVGQRGAVSMATLCTLTGAVNRSAHHAKHDARATADALLALLRHTASTGRFTTIDALLAAHGQGTTDNPSNPGYIRDRGPLSPVLPDDHMILHGAALSDTATSADRQKRLENAAECPRLRCPWLLDEARHAATNGHAPALLVPLAALLPSLTEPGQPGTLLGAVAELVNPLLDPPGVTLARALPWWAKTRPQVGAAAACTTAFACPSCVDRQPCPKDTLYQLVARIAIYAEARELTSESIRNRLVGARPDRRINAWPAPHPDIAAYMMWVLVTWYGNQSAPGLRSTHGPLSTRASTSWNRAWRAWPTKTSSIPATSTRRSGSRRTSSPTAPPTTATPSSTSSSSGTAKAKRSPSSAPPHGSSNNSASRGLRAAKTQTPTRSEPRRFQHHGTPPPRQTWRGPLQLPTPLPASCISRTGPRLPGVDARREDPC